MKLPVIVGMGGINAAGRTSGFHAYKRMVYQSLSEHTMQSTWQDLTCRMQLQQVPSHLLREKILQGTLVRQIDIFNPNHIYTHQSETLKDHLHLNDKHLMAGETIFWPKKSSLLVQSGGCLPHGFHPEKLYHSHYHPRGLVLSVYAMSDALSSLGIDWHELMTKVKPDEVSVYAGSALGQIDHCSLQGLISYPLKDKRPNAKMMPLSLAEMPADFINSYVLNSIGSTGHNMGACATFLYNLRMGISDIQSGRAKIVVVGSSEAPIVPEVIEGFRVMSALATDEALCQLDQVSEPNYRRACRPFSTNAGFVMAESAQFMILMADDFALEMGAPILGSVGDVFVNADANKKSIASPGVGNYVTVAKTLGLAKAILGEKSLSQTYVQAHGTGTPQNRLTESHILNEVAGAFGLQDWKVCAVKSYLGHSIGVAAGDQIMATLGAWQFGILPGIETIDHIASDVYDKNLNILMQHEILDKPSDMKATIINAKGFGGNNASALILSPYQTLDMMQHKYGQEVMKTYQRKADKIRVRQLELDSKASLGQEEMFYHFGTDVIPMEDVKISNKDISMSKFAQKISIEFENPYKEYA